MLYVYHCKKCRATFSGGDTDAPVSGLKCPKCGRPMYSDGSDKEAWAAKSADEKQGVYDLLVSARLSRFPFIMTCLGLVLCAAGSMRSCNNTLYWFSQSFGFASGLYSWVMSMDLGLIFLIIGLVSRGAQKKRLAKFSGVDHLAKTVGKADDSKIREQPPHPESVQEKHKSKVVLVRSRDGQRTVYKQVPPQEESRTARPADKTEPEPFKAAAAPEPRLASSDSERGGRSFLLRLLAVIGVAALIVIIVIGLRNNSPARKAVLASSEASPPQATARPAPPTSAPGSLPFPVNCKNVNFTDDILPDCILTINTAPESDVLYYYVVLMARSTGEDPKKAFVIYVHSGNSAQVHIPVGIYDIYYACGNSWYGEEDLFGESGRYYLFGNYYRFRFFADSYSEHTITLYPDESSNHERVVVSEANFPR